MTSNIIYTLSLFLVTVTTLCFCTYLYKCVHVWMKTSSHRLGNFIHWEEEFSIQIQYASFQPEMSKNYWILFVLIMFFDNQICFDNHNLLRKVGKKEKLHKAFKANIVNLGGQWHLRHIYEGHSAFFKVCIFVITKRAHPKVQTQSYGITSGDYCNFSVNHLHKVEANSVFPKLHELVCKNRHPCISKHFLQYNRNMNTINYTFI